MSNSPTSNSGGIVDSAETRNPSHTSDNTSSQNENSSKILLRSGFDALDLLATVTSK